MLLEHPLSSKYLADFGANTLIGYRKIGRVQTKNATSIVPLNPPNEDGGAFCHLTVAAPKVRIN